MTPLGRGCCYLGMAECLAATVETEWFWDIGDYAVAETLVIVLGMGVVKPRSHRNDRTHQEGNSGAMNVEGNSCLAGAEVRLSWVWHSATRTQRCSQASVELFITESRE